MLLLGGPSTEKVNRYPRKLPDGTVIWTSLSGNADVTKPGSVFWFSAPSQAGVGGASEHVEGDELGALAGLHAISVFGAYLARLRIFDPKIASELR